MQRISSPWFHVSIFALIVAVDASSPLNITTVRNGTFHTLGITLSTYSLQDALFPDSDQSMLSYTYNDSAYLFADACRQADGSTNCTASCNDTSLMFENLETLHNCMVFPQVAAHHYNNNLTAHAQLLVEGLEIEPMKNTSDLSRAVMGHVQSCLSDYCATITGCREQYAGETPSPYSNASYWDFNNQGEDLVDNICGFFSAQVNSDIGGIGVYVSYWIQTGIALLGFVSVLLWNSWIYYIYHGALTLRHGFKKAHDKARWIRNGNQKHLSRLATALTDFQKAQCFFMLAINIAAQFVVRQGGLQPSSLQQIYNTYVFIKVLAISGYLPITFTLFTLHLIGMVSWYLLALSVSSVALSVATLLTIGDFNPSAADLKDLASSFTGGGPDSCGGVQPGAFCYVSIDYFDDNYYDSEDSFDTSRIGSTAFSVLAFCLLVLLLLIIEKAKVLQRPSTRRLMGSLSKKLAPCLAILFLPQRYIRKAFEFSAVRQLSHLVSSMWSKCVYAFVGAINWIQWKVSTQPILHRCSKPLTRRVASWRGSDRYIMAKNTTRRFSQQSLAKTKHMHRTADYGKLFRQYLVASLYIVFSCLYLYYFSVFSRLLAWFAVNNYNSKTWNFGQVVAITVWAPPLCEYIHLELRGMKRGFDHKLLPPYRITKDKDPEVDAAPVVPHDFTPILTYGQDPGKGDYGSLDGPESPESVRRYSEDDLKWQLPVTVQSEGDLSPFSSP